VVDVGRHPVVPLLVAHIFSQFVAQLFWSCNGRPDPDGNGGAARNDELAIGAVRDAVHVIGVRRQRVTYLLAGLDVPQPDGFVATGGGEGAAGRAVRERNDPVLMASHWLTDYVEPVSIQNLNET